MGVEQCSVSGISVIRFITGMACNHQIQDTVTPLKRVSHDKTQSQCNKFNKLITISNS